MGEADDQYPWGWDDNYPSFEDDPDPLDHIVGPHRFFDEFKQAQLWVRNRPKARIKNTRKGYLARYSLGVLRKSNLAGFFDDVLFDFLACVCKETPSEGNIEIEEDHLEDVIEELDDAQLVILSTALECSPHVRHWIYSYENDLIFRKIAQKQERGRAGA